jgi:SufS family cysteine desulfurase
MKNKNIRLLFPFFSQSACPIYLDSAATTHKPQVVIDAMVHWYAYENANVHRGIYALSERATTRYEAARATVARFVGAFSDEIVFTAGSTAGINTFVHVFGLHQIKKGDRIVVTMLEHHSNILPWQMVAQKTGAELVYVPVDASGNLILDDLESIINQHTRLVAVSMASHAIGVSVPFESILAQARAVGAITLIDAAQAVAHQPIDVRALGVDALVFSGHKMYGPTGIGVLYINRRLHDQLAPFMSGGGMVERVDLETAQFQRMPHLLEAGTPAIAQAVGLAAAVDFMVRELPFDQLVPFERDLGNYLRSQLKEIPGICLIGESIVDSHIISFYVPAMHAHDVAAFLDQAGICVRAGSHCAQPLAQALKRDSWVRVSSAAYTKVEDIDYLIAQLKKLAKALPLHL